MIGDSLMEFADYLIGDLPFGFEWVKVLFVIIMLLVPFCLFFKVILGGWMFKK